MNPGEYTEPLVRKTFVSAPMVSGYTTSRLRIMDDPFVAAGTASIGDFHVAGLYINTGGTNVVVSVSQSPDDGTNYATRTTIVSGFTLVPGGRAYKGMYPTQKFIEVSCSSGNSTIQVQLDSRLKFEQMAFDKVDPGYPPQLWQKIG